LAGIASAAGRKVLQIIGSLVLVGVLAAGYFAYQYFTHDTDLAKAGDCLVGNSGKNIKTIDCEDGKAQWKVLARVSSEAGCNTYKDTDATMSHTGGRRSSSYVLCLQEIKK
jgi:hypothetical protein